MQFFLERNSGFLICIHTPQFLRGQLGSNEEYFNKAKKQMHRTGSKTNSAEALMIMAALLMMRRMISGESSFSRGTRHMSDITDHRKYWICPFMEWNFGQNSLPSSFDHSSILWEQRFSSKSFDNLNVQLGVWLTMFWVECTPQTHFD